MKSKNTLFAAAALAAAALMSLFAVAIEQQVVIMNPFQWVGGVSCFFGLLSLVLLTSNNKKPIWGLYSFLISIICWVLFGIETGTIIGFIAVQLSLTAPTLFGLYVWTRPVEA